MVSTHKKRESKRRLLNQLKVFVQDFIIGKTVSDSEENGKVNECTGDQEFTVDNSDSNLLASESSVNVRHLERCFNKSIDKEMVFIITLSKIKFRTRF